MPAKLSLSDITMFRQWIDELYEQVELGVITEQEKEAQLLSAQLNIAQYCNSTSKRSFEKWLSLT